MPILSVRHVTTYHYHQPVAFGEHRMMLRPRDDDDQKVLESELQITPRPRQLDWTQDDFGNHIATAHFAASARELRFVSTIRIDHAPARFRKTDIADFARICPFAYPADDGSSLRRFAEPPTRYPEIDRWSAQFFGSDGLADTHDLLVDMTKTLRRTFKHVSRHEKGIQDPAQTLKLGSGSCRDLSVLMIAALRSRGIAARFVSGYLHLFQQDLVQQELVQQELVQQELSEDDDDIGGNTHAWVQAHVPGPGWVDFDPAGGVVGNQNHIRVAAVHHPCEAIPLQGTWYGSASDHSAMKVAVRVTAAGN